jgi:ankyrin repeat protein
MHVLGIISYWLLLFTAIYWVLKLRIDLSINNLGTALSSLLLVVFAIAVPLLKINLLHSLWMIPVGLLFGTFLLLTFRTPLFWLFQFLRPLGQLWLKTLRFGIPDADLSNGDADFQSRMQSLLNYKTSDKNIDSQATQPTTPLLRAILNNEMDDALSLIFGGANVNEKSVDGTTPLMLAAANGNKEIVQRLLEKGADVGDRDNKKLTARLWAIQNKHTDVEAILNNHPQHILRAELAKKDGSRGYVKIFQDGRTQIVLNKDYSDKDTFIMAMFIVFSTYLSKLEKAPFAQWAGLSIENWSGQHYSYFGISIMHYFYEIKNKDTDLPITLKRLLSSCLIENNLSPLNKPLSPDVRRLFDGLIQKCGSKINPV